MSLIELFAQPIGRLLTLALVHFLWQGFAVVFVLIALEELCRIRRAAARYACSLASLVLMAVCPLFTISWLSSDSGMSWRAGSGALARRGQPAVFHFEVSRFLSYVDDVPLPSYLMTAQPYVLGGWLVGVTLFGGRLMAGAVGLARLRRRRIQLPGKMAHIVERLGYRMQMQALPVVFLSE